MPPSSSAAAGSSLSESDPHVESHSSTRETTVPASLNPACDTDVTLIIRCSQPASWDCCCKGLEESAEREGSGWRLRSEAEAELRLGGGYSQESDEIRVVREDGSRQAGNSRRQQIILNLLTGFNLLLSDAANHRMHSLGTIVEGKRKQSLCITERHLDHYHHAEITTSATIRELCINSDRMAGVNMKMDYAERWLGDCKVLSSIRSPLLCCAPAPPPLPYYPQTQSSAPSSPSDAPRRRTSVASHRPAQGGPRLVSSPLETKLRDGTTWACNGVFERVIPRRVRRRRSTQVPSEGREGGGEGGGLRREGPGGTGGTHATEGFVLCINRITGFGKERLLELRRLARCLSVCDGVREREGARRFFILLPWVLIVIIMIDMDSKRTVRAPAAARTGRAQRAARNGDPGVGGAQNQSALPVIYAITPTYTRPVQKAELTRLAHAFRQVPRFHWIVVEDSTTRTELVARFLARCGVPYTHLHVFTPRRFKRTGMPRATEQRNVALAWLRQHRGTRDAGVVFFADDDNTYSLELFEEGRGARVDYPREPQRSQTVSWLRNTLLYTTSLSLSINTEDRRWDECTAAVGAASSGYHAHLLTRSGKILEPEELESLKNDLREKGRQQQKRNEGEGFWRHTGKLKGPQY
ncbi:hypothetical protein FQN60_010512 [Etheostoma spectabile]|uniref:Galactosylgalactosylxylosylprotein 3-beta-glucuronosyltransferase n=1 Tax=Etheostoma spectabile TaxID=54343 RepID=A0A5J5D535_9PERO|nr:hypothetical protein FQN60_010512 [Etheostoma spectabile]